MESCTNSDTKSLWHKHVEVKSTQCTILDFADCATAKFRIMAENIYGVSEPSEETVVETNEKAELEYGHIKVERNDENNETLLVSDNLNISDNDQSREHVQLDSAIKDSGESIDYESLVRITH